MILLKMEKMDKKIEIYIFLLLAIGGGGLCIFLLSLVITMIEMEFYQLSFCLRSECLANIKTMYKPQIELLFGVASLTGTMTTIGGIFVAVSTYLNNVSTNALSNHIAHLQVFQDYLIIEVGKHDHLSISAIDVYGWYNSIFTMSRQGSLNVSDSYNVSLQSINNNIILSNNESETAKSGSFQYKKHQSRMTLAFNNFGINMGFHPRNDYFEIEGQVLTLITSINKAFCSNSGVIEFEQRKYN